jgi:hypothetical protein
MNLPNPIRKLLRKHSIYLTARDCMCYPQLNPNEDCFAEPDETYAQRIRDHIEFVIADKGSDHEDPTQVVIY